MHVSTSFNFSHTKVRYISYMYTYMKVKYVFSPLTVSKN